MIARWLARKLILDTLDHEIRNATSNITGIIKRSKKAKVITSADVMAIYTQLYRIEEALTYVRKLNKGQK